ncbi:MAG: IS200/IS605 family element transposase accessory protein TnpB [Rhizobacter sp.]|nr:IS200/IS605 family element transposase accessory protein TnpB [Chlorobiales bacterium]
MEKIIHKAYKFRLAPTAEQQAYLAVQFGHCRFVFNHFLNLRIQTYAETGKGLSYAALCKQLTSLKQQGETKWLSEAYSQTLQQSLRDLDTAYNNFFNKRAKFPSFKKKSNRQSCRIPQGFEIIDRSVKLPKFAEPFKFRKHREIKGTVKHISISKEPSGQYFIAFNVEELVDVPEPKTKKAVGIDLGLKHFAVLSDGAKVSAPNFYRASELRLQRAQRRLSKKIKGSRNRDKARLQVSKIHRDIRNARTNFLHQLSHRTTDENQVIVLESLNIAGMIRNHHLAKSISDCSWSEFVRQLKYKSEWKGGTVIEAGRFYPSSKRCSKCGNAKQALKLSERVWICEHCHTEHDRDINAAKNLLKFALREQGDPKCNEPQ